MFKIIVDSLKTGILTEPRPFDLRPSFGFPVIDFPRCTLCEECARACPTGAIHLDAAGSSGPYTLKEYQPQPAFDRELSAATTERPVAIHEGHTTRRRTLSLSYASCIQCRACVDACPEQAVSPGREHEVAAYTREHLQQSALFDVEGAAGPCTFRELQTQPGPSLEESAARLRDRIRGRLGRSLHVRQVDAGSCNGCELEIAATTNPLFDLERFGVHFVASPRHADVLLVTGPVTRNMEVALQRTYEATPEPRVVVAVGACGCSGGIFGEGGYAALGGVDRVLPVDVYIPGCPPRPQAILNGLLVAMGKREARARPV